MIKQIKLRKDEKEKLNEKRKYYLVDANKLYFINKKDNFVYLDYYFEKNDVDEKYRKVLFQIVPLQNKAIEFISGLEFDTAFLSKVDSLSIFLKPYVAGNSNLVKGIEDDAIGYQEYEGIVFNADIKSKKNYDYIINFLKDIKKNDELEKYIRSISCFMADGIIYTKERRIINTLNNQIIELDMSSRPKNLHLF